MKKIVYVLATIFLFLVACDKEEETGITVTGITLNQEDRTLEIGDTAALMATLLPEDASNKTIYWSSSAGGVATVSDAGLVTAVSEGFAIITVQTEDGGFEAYCNITVVPEAINVTGISLDISEDTLDINCSVQLTATITPVDATDKSIAWSTSDATIASVSTSGLVTGLGGGKATITATTNDGGFTATCEVLVNGKGTISTLMDKGFLKTSEAKVGIDLAVDADGLPYLALNAYDATVSNSKASCEVWKYASGTNWNQFGDRVAITGKEAYAPGIIIDEADNVYVSHLYQDDINDVRFGANVVAFSSGGAWTYLGTGNSSLIRNGSDNLNRGSELALKDDGTLLVANMYYGDGFVHYWNGTGWTSYNGYKTDSENFWAGGIDIECYGNKPLVSVRSGSGTPGKTGVLFGNETNGVNGQWQWLGSSYASTSSEDCSFQDNMVSEASLAVNSMGDVYTAFKAYFNNNWHVVVRKFDAQGSDWVTLKSSECGNENQVDVVVANDIVYLLIALKDGGIEIYKLTNCGEWILEGITEKPDYYYIIDAIAGKNGEIYIGYECTYNADGQVGVFKYTPYSAN